MPISWPVSLGSNFFRCEDVSSSSLAPFSCLLELGLASMHANDSGLSSLSRCSGGAGANLSELGVTSIPCFPKFGPYDRVGKRVRRGTKKHQIRKAWHTSGNGRGTPDTAFGVLTKETYPYSLFRVYWIISDRVSEVLEVNPYLMRLIKDSSYYGSVDRGK